jgi:hypothetical protein
MTQARGRFRLPTPTVIQMMKLVVLGAVVSSCLAFGLQLARELHLETWQIVVVEALIAPLATAITAFPLLRKGQLKDWLILACVSTSLIVTLGFVFVAMAEDVRRRTFVQRQPLDDGFLLVGSIVVLLLCIGLIYLLNGLVPRRCPDCRRWTLLPQAKFIVRSEARQGRSYQCLGCRGLFHNRGGFWDAIPTDPEPPKP